MMSKKQTLSVETEEGNTLFLGLQVMSVAFDIIASGAPYDRPSDWNQADGFDLGLEEVVRFLTDVKAFQVSTADEAGGRLIPREVWHLQCRLDELLAGPALYDVRFSGDVEPDSDGEPNAWDLEDNGDMEPEPDMEPTGFYVLSDVMPGAGRVRAMPA